MNENEQKVANALLEKILAASPQDACMIAGTYQTITQAALNRRNAEAIKN